MRPKAPTVWEDPWRGTAAVENGPQLDTPAWFVWLEDPATISFAYPVTNRAQGYIEGFMTLRKEARVRGGVYWTAYWRVDGRLRKVYLGHATAVTALRLRAIAAAWLAQRAPASALSPPPGARGDPPPQRV